MISKYDMSTTGHRIRYLRKKNMESVEAIASALGCATATWYSYERKDYVPLDIIILVAKRYNVDVNYLLCLTDIERPFVDDEHDEQVMRLSIETWNKLRAISDISPELTNYVSDAISFWDKWVNAPNDLTFDNAGISDRAKKLKEDSKVGYSAIAKEIDVSESTVRHLFNNKAKWSKKYIESIAKYFGVDIKTLIGGV